MLSIDFIPNSSTPFQLLSISLSVEPFMKHDTCTDPALRVPLRGEDRKLPSRTLFYLPLLARKA